MIDLVEHQAFGSGFFQQALAESVKRCKGNFFPAFAGGADDACFHFAGSLVCER